MLIKTYGSAVYGIEATTITIEINVTEGLHRFIVGLPDSAVKESMQRVDSAIRSNGYAMPRTKLVINMAPAGIRKSGPAFDLPIAMGILAATGQLESPLLKQFIMMGELGLDGSIQPIQGVLPIALQTRREFFRGLIVPALNAEEASIVTDLRVFAFSHIGEVIQFFKVGGEKIQPVRNQAPAEEGWEGEGPGLDFSEVKGQESIKRGLEIAAAGGHNAILIGPPGSGKTMLARRMPTILPPLSREEALETTKIHSVAGGFSQSGRLIRMRPFRSPHHTLSKVALIGGGSIPQPGEVSMAHNGVLFLDELPEFQRDVLEVLRQPMEERRVTISRARMTADFPAAFILLASMNPCPCGYYNHPTRACNCPPSHVQKYLHKLSGPLLDRIDLHIQVKPVPYEQLSAEWNQQNQSAAARRVVENSAQIRRRVMTARNIQLYRYRRWDYQHFGKAGPQAALTYCNAQMNSRQMEVFCRLDPDGARFVREAVVNNHLSARGYDRVLRICRTVADLEGSEAIRAHHVAEAILYRTLDGDRWIR